MQLSAEEGRVIGALVEKELTTPDQYPLTVKALVAACNQASNRDPVVGYGEAAVMEALHALKAERLVRFVLPSHGRTATRYRHVLDEAMALDRRQCALVAVLLLRGAQTVGELRMRTDRMADFTDLDEVEHELQFMSSREVPLTQSLGRRPGQKEERWTCPLVTPGLQQARTDGESPSFNGDPSPNEETIEVLRAEVARLGTAVEGLRSDLDALLTRLGD